MKFLGWDFCLQVASETQSLFRGFLLFGMVDSETTAKMSEPQKGTVTEVQNSSEASNWYQEEYGEDFVDKWDDLINWPQREKGEKEFFIELLKNRGKHKILDVATGTGYHSIKLLDHGFDVTSGDGSANMLTKAFNNAREHGHMLRTVQLDWRWLSRDVHDKYDAIICLGNSFTHLFSENDRRKALAEFYSALRHDGILIVDHRNYDVILDQGFKFKHTYYYGGENVSAEPDIIKPDHVRFQYKFADNKKFHLNFFPLRKPYMTDLLQQVGFQRIETFGDFQETFSDEDPDFFIHIAEKEYLNEPNTSSRDKAVVQTTKDYYDSENADNFYYHVWGGEDIHVGLYTKQGEPVRDASARGVRKMGELLNDVDQNTRMLDIGAGYGGTARYFAKTYGCQVDCLNLSEKENERNIEKNKAQGLDDKVKVYGGNFEELPFKPETYDVVISQDSLLHSANKKKVLQEVDRVLRKGGKFLFTDPMQANQVPAGVLDPVLERIHLDSMGSVAKYREIAKGLNWKELQVVEMPEQLVNHYSSIRQYLRENYESLKDKISTDYMDRMIAGLGHWVEQGRAGHLNWGYLLFQK